MLEPNTWSGIQAGQAENARTEGPETVSAAVVAAFLRRYVWVVLAWTAAGIALAAAYALTATPHYTAESRLVISPQLPQTIRERNIEGSFTLDNAQVESHIAVLRSEKVAAMVVAMLGLEGDPNFQPKPGRLARLLGHFVTLPAPGPLTPFERDRATMEIFQSGLQVRRVGLSYAIDVSFRSPDPERAAQIANAAVAAYIRDQLEAKSETAKIGSEWLEGRLRQLRTQMIGAARDAQEFRSRHDYRIPAASGREGADAEEAGAQTQVPQTQVPTALRRGRNSLNELDTTAETYRRIYESFLQSYTESVQRQSFPVPDARVVTAATPPLDQSDPRVKLVVSLGALLGGIVGFGVALARHNFDTRVWSAQQIREDVGVECLGCLPRIRPGDAGRSRRIARSLGVGRSGGRDLVQVTRRHGYVDAAPRAPLAPFGAALIGLRTRIGFGVGRVPVRSVGFASMSDGEGKSTLAGNLAALCAQSGARVLLVDADLRGRSLTGQLAPGAETGLVQVLEGTAALEAALVREVGVGLDLLPSGGLPCPVASEFLLGSEAMQGLMEALEGRYDLVVFDLPSLGQSMSAVALGALVEAVVLVTEYGRTRSDLASEGAHWLRAAQARLLGAVITKVEA